MKHHLKPVNTKEPAHRLERVQELEMRLKHVEALVQEMRIELEEIQGEPVNESEKKQIDRMRSYQDTADKLFRRNKTA